MIYIHAVDQLWPLLTCTEMSQRIRRKNTEAAPSPSHLGGAVNRQKTERIKDEKKLLMAPHRAAVNYYFSVVANH